ncbi:MAG: glycosyltransferase family 4 protein [Acidobacteriota bacterium]
MTNVLALVTDAYGGRGGIAQYNRDFLSALASVESKVVVLPRHAPDAKRPPNGVEQRPARFGRLAYSWSAITEALRMKPDIVFCGHVFMAPLAWLAAKLARAKLVIQTHGIDAWPRPSKFVRVACEQAAMILSVSRYTRARVLDWAVMPPERVVVIPDTVSDCFTPGNGAALRREWNLEGRKVLLTVGRMAASERYKGHDRVIKALPDLIAAGIDIMYVIAGEGDDRPRLEQLAREVGVSDRLRFVGALPLDTLIEAYRMADLFVMPSTGEGFGIAFLEAMACGTPALGLDVAGARDALCEGKLGQAAIEKEFGATLARMIATTRPDSEMLSNAVWERFGRDHFSNAVRSAILRPLEA